MHHSLILLLQLQSDSLSFILHSFLSLFSLSSSLSRFSDFNVVFTFSVSLIDFAPSAPIPLPVILSSFSFSFSSLFSFFLTSQIHLCQCGVHFQHFTHCFCSFISNLIVCHSFFRFLFRFLFHPHSLEIVPSVRCSPSKLYSATQYPILSILSLLKKHQCVSETLSFSSLVHTTQVKFLCAILFVFSKNHSCNSSLCCLSLPMFQKAFISSFHSLRSVGKLTSASVCCL